MMQDKYLNVVLVIKHSGVEYKAPFTALTYVVLTIFPCITYVLVEILSMLKAAFDVTVTT